MTKCTYKTARESVCACPTSHPEPPPYTKGTAATPGYALPEREDTQALGTLSLPPSLPFRFFPFCQILNSYIYDLVKYDMKYWETKLG